MGKSEIVSRIEDLHKKIKRISERSDSIDQKRSADYALKYLEILNRGIESQSQIFGVEPWHPLAESGAYLSPGEYLVRLKDSKGEDMPPYPAVMSFYDSGFTTDIDTILFLCALEQFKEDDEKQVAINVSARSLNAGNFVKPVLAEMEAMGMSQSNPERIIIEMHDTNAQLISQDVLKQFHAVAASFAIDDVGLSISDVFRLAEFDGVAHYIKIDRKAVLAEMNSQHSLDHMMSFIRSLLPGIIVVAEGVKTVEHARYIHKAFPDINYVQGMNLPGRDMFGKRWKTLALGSLS